MTGQKPRPAPEFRPRKKRQQNVARAAWRSPWGLTGVLAVLIIAAAGFGGWLVFRGGDDSAPARGLAGGPDPKLEGPASRYAPSLEEAPPGYQVITPETYDLNAFQFAAQSGLFTEVATGEQRAEEWRYLSGRRTSLEPIGKGAEVLQGGYWLTVDNYLFEYPEGAEAAFNHLKTVYDGVTGSERVDAAPLGNQSAAWALQKGTVLQSETPAIYHRFVFRRGNLLTIVQTMGATPFMTIEQARDIAIVVDERALGQRDQSTPTPAAAPTLPVSGSTTR